MFKRHNSADGSLHKVSLNVETERSWRVLNILSFLKIPAYLQVFQNICPALGPGLPLAYPSPRRGACGKGGSLCPQDGLRRVPWEAWRAPSDFWLPALLGPLPPLGRRGPASQGGLQGVSKHTAILRQGREVSADPPAPPPLSYFPGPRPTCLCHRLKLMPIFSCQEP